MKFCLQPIEGVNVMFYFNIKILIKTTVIVKLM